MNDSSGRAILLTIFAGVVATVIGTLIVLYIQGAPPFDKPMFADAAPEPKIAETTPSDDSVPPEPTSGPTEEAADPAPIEAPPAADNPPAPLTDETKPRLTMAGEPEPDPAACAAAASKESQAAPKGWHFPTLPPNEQTLESDAKIHERLCLFRCKEIEITAEHVSAKCTTFTDRNPMYSRTSRVCAGQIIFHGLGPGLMCKLWQFVPPNEWPKDDE